MCNVVHKTSFLIRNQYDEGFPVIKYTKLNNFRINEIRDIYAIRT